MTESNRLGSLRSEIERVTLEIVGLVGLRNSLAEDVAQEKARLGLPLLNPDVEKHLRVTVVDKCEDIGVSPAFGVRLLNQLIAESLRVQQKRNESQVAFNAHDFFVKAKEMERSGKDVFHLEVGEPDFGPPKTVTDAITNAVCQGLTRYTESAGIPSLREKIANQIGSIYQREVSPEEVIVTVSGKYALFLGVASTIHDGNEVIIIDPSFPAYSRCVRAVGGSPVHISTHLDDDWNIDVSLVENHINESTKLILLNSPCNPTGKIVDESTFQELVSLAIENDIRIVSDEVYSRFSYSPHTSILQFPQCSQITVKSFSKPYGMTGFRLGYAISDPVTVKTMANLQHLHVTCAPEFIQHAGLAALDCDEEVRRNATTIESRLKSTSRLFEGLPVSFKEAEGGFYIFAKMTEDGMDGQTFAERLLSETGVCVMPGIVYGSKYDSFFRVSVCQPEEKLAEAIGRMKEVLG